MHLVAFDTEAELSEAGNAGGRMACASIARPDRDPQLFGRKAALTIFRSYLLDDDALLIGHNTAYDLGSFGTEDESLIPLIFAALEAGRVRDTIVRETLILIKQGRSIDNKRPGLSLLSEQYLGYALDKGEDSDRYWYGDLIDKPLDQWTENQRAYPMRDATSTLGVFKGQQQQGGIDAGQWLVSPDEVLQTRAAFVMQLMRMWGFRTDGEIVRTVKADLEREVATARVELLAEGLYKDKNSKRKQTAGVPPDLGRDMAAIKKRVLAAFKARGEPPVLTEGAVKAQERGEKDLDKYVSTAKDILYDTQDELLAKLAKVGPAEKALGTFIPLIETGVEVPIIVGWNSLGARSGRTSCGDSDNDEIGNWQNPSKRRGIREAVKARDGYVIVKADFELAELCSLAQVTYKWFGQSRMRDEIMAGNDLHLKLACNSPTLLGGMTYEEAKRLKKLGDDLVDKKRGVAKNTNFGFPGGMGPKKFIQNAWTNGIRPRIPLAEAEALKRDWLMTWPEMRLYFERIAREDQGGRPAVQLFSGRVRGFNVGDFCSRANTYFQGLTADGAKHAMWLVAHACYVDETSPLFGSRIILFVHDEIVLESPIALAPDAAVALGKLMKQAMEIYTPDVPASTELSLSDRWYKKAGPVKGPDGRLVLWHPSCSFKVEAKKLCGRRIGPIDAFCPEHERQAA